MLNFLRRGVKTWVAKALLALLILSFAVWGIGAEIFSFSFSTPIARVGETKISAEQFARAIQREQDHLSQSAGEIVPLDRLRQLGVDQRIIAGLQRDAAFTEEMTQYGIRIPDEAAIEAVASRPEFQHPDGSFAPENVSYYLGRQGISEAEFLDLNRSLVGQNLLAGPATGATRPPPGMATRIATYLSESRRIATLTLPLEMARDPGIPAQSQLEEYYDQNTALYTEPERRSGTYLHVDLVGLITTLQPSDAEVEAAYQDAIDAFTQVPTRVIDQISMPDLATAQAAAERIRAGETTLEDLATELGYDASTLSLGRVTAEDVPTATADAIFAVTEPGIIDPVELPVGVALIRINEVELGGQRQLEDVADEISLRLAQDAAYARAPELANQIDELRAGGSQLEEIAQATGLTLGTFVGLAEDGTLPGDAQAEGVLATPAFLQEVFEALEAEERPLIDTPEGGFLVVMLDEINPGGLQDFATVRNQVTQDWIQDRQLADLELRGAKLAASLAGRGTLEANASALNLPLATPAPFTRETGPLTYPQETVEITFATLLGEGFSQRLPDGTGVMVGEVLEVIPLETTMVQQLVGQLDLMIEQTIRADALEFLARAISASHDAGQDPAAVDEVFTYLGSAHSGGGY
ncbi:MAG: SurA N-terminal domain-containing protein [Pseudomonadota bacterium]